MRGGTRRALAIAGATALIALCAACSPAESESEATTTVLVVADGDAARIGERSWPHLLDEEGFAVTFDEREGSDWLTAAPRSVADRVSDASADAVVISLGMGGQDAPDELVAAAVRHGIAAAAANGARVVVVSPTTAAASWGAVLESEARSAGAVFVDVSDIATAGGEVPQQRELAERVAEAIG